VALEQFSVELQAELSKFVNNINIARDSLSSITARATDVAKQVSTAFESVKLGQAVNVAPLVDNLNKIKTEAIGAGNAIINSFTGAQQVVAGLANLKFPSNISDFLNAVSQVSKGIDVARITAADAGLNKLAGTLDTVNKAVIGGSGVVAALTTFRSLLQSVQSGTTQSSEKFAEYAKSLQGAVNTFSPLLANLGTFGKLLQNTFTLLVSNEKQLSSFVNVLRQLSQVPAISSAISGLIGLLGTLGTRLQGVISTFTQFRLSTGNISSAISVVATAFQNLPKIVAGGIDNINKLTQTFTGFFSTINRLVPGLNTVSTALAKTGAAFITIAGPLGQVNSLAATAAGLIGGGLLAASVAAQASLILLGKAIAAVGDKLISFNQDAAKAAGDAQLQFKLLQAELNNTQDALGVSQGSVDKWKKAIQALSAQTGFSQAELSKVAARFVQLSQNVRLSEEQLFALVKTTALTGLEINDLTRSLASISGAFVGETASVRQLIGANVLVENVNQKVTESIQRQGLQVSQLNKVQETQIRSTEIFNLIQQAAAGNAAALADSQDNLTVATLKLNGALQQFNIVLGKQSEGLFAAFNNILANTLNNITETIPGIISLAGSFTTLLGALLKFSGIALQIITVVGLVTTGVRALNLALSGGIGGFAKFSSAVNKTFSVLLGTTVQIKSVGDVLKNTFVLATNGLKNLITSLTSFTTQFSRITPIVGAFKGTIAGAFSTFATELKIVGTSLLAIVTRAKPVAEALAAIRATTIGAVAGFAAVIAKGIAFGIVFDTIFSAVKKVVSVYNEVTKGQSILTNALSQAFGVTNIWTAALQKLASVMEFTVLLLATSLAGSFASLIFVIRSVVGAIELLLVAGSKLPFIGKRLEGAVTKVQNIGKALGLIGAATVDTTAKLGKATVDFTLGFDAAANGADKAAREIQLSGKKILTAIDPQQAEGIAQAIVKVFDTQLKGINQIADVIETRIQQQATLSKQVAERAISDEHKRSAAVLTIEQNLVTQTVALEQERLNKTLGLIAERARFEQENLIVILGKEAQNATKRIEAQQKIVAKSRESEQTILTDVLARLREQLQAVQKQQSDRVEIIQNARKRINEIESGLFDDLQGLRLKTLDEDEKQVELRRIITERIAEVNRLAAANELELAQQQIEKVKGLVANLTSDDTIAGALQQASEAAFAKTEFDLDKVVLALQQSLKVDLPQSTKDGVDRILNEISRTGSALLTIKENAGEVQSVLSRIGEIQGLREQGEFLKQIAASEIDITTKIQSIAQKGLANADQMATAIQAKIDTLAGSLQKSLEQSDTEIDVLAKLNEASVAKAIEDIKAKAKINPILFTVDADPASIQALQDSIPTIIPEEKRQLPLNISIDSEKSLEDLKKIVNDIELEKEVVTKFLPDATEVEDKITELSNSKPSVPLALQADEGTVKGGATVPIPNIPQEIQKVVGTVPLKAKVGFEIDQDSLNAVKSELQKPINIPLAVPTIDIPGGSIHRLEEAGTVIGEVITPDSPVSIAAAMDQGIAIPGVGTASFSDAPNAITNAVSPEDPIAILSKFDDQVFLPGIGFVPIQQAQDALLTSVQPTQPVEIEVAVDEESLEQAQNDISVSVSQSSGNAGGKGGAEFTNAFAQAIINSQNNAAINKFIQTHFGAVEQLAGTTRVEVESVLEAFNLGVADAQSTLQSLIALDKQVQLNAIENRKKRKESGGATTTRVLINEADILGGSIHPLDEAAEVIAEVITPPPVSSSVNIDTSSARSEIEKALNNASNFIDSSVVGINQKLQSINAINLKSNISDIVDQLNFLKGQSVNIPVNLNAKDIDIQGGSLHKLSEAGDVIKKLLTPEKVEVGLSALTNPVRQAVQATAGVSTTATQTPFGRNAAINKNVTVKIDINGESFPVTTDEKGANSMERFGKSLQRATRSSGEYISPYSKKFTG